MDDGRDSFERLLQLVQNEKLDPRFSVEFRGSPNVKTGVASKE